MTILAGDIKLLASAVMNDVPEGGGPPTSTVIQDGTSNSIFPDISELDRAGGRVNLRKVFAGVRTANTDGFFGSNVIVAEPYEDPRVSVTLFTTGDTFDRRDDAASRMESYLAKGPTYSGYLFGDHLAGQMNVTLLQRLEVPPPVIGATLVMRKNEGLSNQFDQFIRVTDVASVEREFTDVSGNFARLQVSLDISDALQEDFNGFDALRLDASINYTGKTKISDTVVADAARYYGVVPLEEEAEIGDFTVKAEGIYTQLVPSTRIEVPIADARMNQQSSALVKAGETYTRTLNLAFTTSQALFIGGSILPGSLIIERGGITINDKGSLLVNAAGDQVGTIDHGNGVATLSQNVFGTSAGNHTVSYLPAFAPTMVGESIAIPVTPEGQRLSYVITLDPPPARKTLQISFRALGRWYVLTEDGSGAIRGADSSFGAGTINYSTGTVSVTLGALPDVDSYVIYTFVAASITRPIEQIPKAGPSLPRAFGKPVSVGAAIKPGTVTITWNDGTARSATDSAGVLTGDATGSVNYAEGVIDFRPNLLPAVNTAVTINVTESTQVKTELATLTDGGSNWTGTLTAPLEENSVELSVVAQYNLPELANAWEGPNRGAPVTICVRLFDDGAGNLKMANVDSNVTVGTINYSTGAISVVKTFAGFKVDAVEYSEPSVNTSGSDYYYPQPSAKIGYSLQSVDLLILNGPGVNTPATPTWSWFGGQENAIEARYSGNDGSGLAYPFNLDSIFLPANPNGFGATTGYALNFTSFNIGSSLYVLRQDDGTWQRDPSPTTGVGAAAGIRAVVGGMSGALITNWTTGVSSAPTNVAGSEQPNVSGSSTLLTVDMVTFRTAVAPLLNGGFQVAGNWAGTGAGFTATAASDGTIVSGSAVVGETPGSLGVFGQVDYEMGVVNLIFGRRVPASMATDDFVMDLSYMGLTGVSYVEIVAVQADTLRYNATGYSYLPLDPDILGLNPVRLPADGRVPIFRPGTFAVVGHTGSVTATVSNGNTISAGRTRLSRVRVIGDDGLLINTGYTADLDAGTVTFTDVTGYDQPVTVQHRIEDMALVSDAQINGQITFTRPLTHDFPVGSFVSSALVAGDVSARTSVVFDQSTWTNVWQDSAIGSAATGTFNDTASPIAVSNLGALTERWACIFTSSTGFNIVGEHVGVIGTGSTGVDASPMNPGAGAPYFTIPAAGWGLGWSTGNVMRFNTIGALVPVWVARTILQGPETVDDDAFTLLVRGDVDRP